METAVTLVFDIEGMRRLSYGRSFMFGPRLRGGRSARRTGCTWWSIASIVNRSTLMSATATQFFAHPPTSIPEGTQLERLVKVYKTSRAPPVFSEALQGSPLLPPFSFLSSPWAMSFAPAVNAPSPDDAEKGVASVYPGEIAITFANEKGDLTTAEIVPVLPQEEKVHKPPSKPAQTASKPAKRKVSKWILWQLWFNTYR